MRQELVNSIIDVVRHEQEESMKKYPLFNSTHEGYAVLLEELEEAKEELEKIDKFVEKLWHNVRENAFEDGKYHTKYKDSAIVNVLLIYNAAIDLACETVQVAAMANKFVESLKPKE